MLGKYDSSKSIDFDADELTKVFGILNLNLTTFIETRLSEYRNFIVQAIHEQNQILTELGGEYLNLDNQGARIEAMRYMVQNIAKVRSPFMLDIIVGIIGHRADRR